VVTLKENPPACRRAGADRAASGEGGIKNCLEFYPKINSVFWERE